MMLRNPFQMNDWEIKKFLHVVFSVQFAMWGAIGLDLIGIQIPIIRQVISFIYLSFIPGILILRIFKLHKLGNIATFLLSVGLSLSALMWVGFLINLVYPVFGISKPISFDTLVFTISAFVLIMCYICYIRDNKFINPDYIDITNVFQPSVLFLLLIPFISIFGTYFVNSSKNNLLLMIMIILIALTTLVIGFGKFIPDNLYPLVIWVFSISLIYHVTLISQYLVVNDVIHEYRISKTVIDYSFWDWTISDNYNSVLSNVILVPIFYTFYNMDLTWIFKIVYPLLYSFVSIGVYNIHLNITENKKTAFLSSFFFITIIPSIFQIPLIIKQSTAEIFLVLLLMIFLSDDINIYKKSVLSIIFAASLIVSHYGTSFLIMLALIFVYLCNVIEKIVVSKKLGSKSILDFTTILPLKTNYSKTEVISLGFVVLFIIFVFSWQIYITTSSTFISLVYIGDNIVNTIFNEFFDPQNSRGTYILTKKEASTLHLISKLFYILSQFFIVCGFLKAVREYRKSNFNKKYIYFGMYFLLLLVAAILVSGVAAMDPRRLFHISLFILSPFCISGGILVCKKFANIFCSILSNIGFNGRLKINFEQSMKILFIFFIIFFLFSTRFVYEIANDNPNSISISQESIHKCDSLDDKAAFYRGLIITQDVFSSKWLSVNMRNNETIYRADSPQGFPDLTIYGGVDISLIKHLDNTKKEIDRGYIQLSYLNIVEKTGSNWENHFHQIISYDILEIYHILFNKNKIYDNGGSQIFLV